MARRAARGRGGKKNLKVTLKDVKAAMEENSQDVDGEAGLSEEERNGEFLESGTQGEKGVEEKELAEALAVSNLPEVCSVLPGVEVISEGNVEVSGVKKGLLEGEFDVEQKKTGLDWSQLFRSEKSFGSLKYFAPSREDGKVVVKPPKEAMEEGILKWSPSLVGQFLDKPLPYYIVKRFVDNLWAQYGKVEVFLLENGLYLFRFRDEKTRDEVMEAKLWNIANKPLILRKWTPGMQLLKLSLSNVPVWIKLHNLPIEFWNNTCLSYVASGVGKPLCADFVTEEQLRLGFARVLVEVNIDSDFPKEIEIVGADGSRVAVGIEYPWLPVKCKKCKAFGHLAHTCTKIEKQIWLPKRTDPAHSKQVGLEIKKVNEMKKGDMPNAVNSEQWKVVRPSRNFSASKLSAKDSQRHWSNSFHLLARTDGRFESGEVRGSDQFSQSLQKVIEDALNEENANLLKDKGKSKMEEEEEVLMRGFSPTT
jgi:hypothetical protein